MTPLQFKWDARTARRRPRADWLATLLATALASSMTFAVVLSF